MWIGAGGSSEGKKNCGIKLVFHGIVLTMSRQNILIWKCVA